MTELLTDTMRERADGIDRPLVDFDAVMRAGDRRRKRRGTLVVVGAAAVCAIVGFGAVQVAGTSGGAEAPGYANAGAFTERKVTYATGSTIHYGNEQIDVGDEDVRAFVQTDDGFVFADENGIVYLADGSTVDEIGSGVAGGRYLRADDSGSYAAWIDSAGDGAPEFVVYDTATMTEVVRTSEGNHAGMGTLADDRPAFIFAVDGNDAYVRNANGLARIEIPSGNSVLLRPGVDSGFAIPDVEEGWILRRLNTGYAHDGSVPPGTVMSRDPKADEPLIVAYARDLSPDARYVSTDFDDSERIFDTKTHEEVVLDTAAYDFQAVSRWLDNDTVAVMALQKPYSDPTVSLLTCEIPSGSCQVAVADIDYAGLQLPVGEHLERG